MTAARLPSATRDRTETAAVTVRQVQKIFKTGAREVVALKDIDLTVNAGEFVCLLGPSGCGKSTLLNAIAGFALPSAGEINAFGQVVREPGPERGMVFQEYALFPWMSVARNIAFGLDIKGWPKAKIKARVDSLLEMLRLTEFRDRYPKDLSGGMRQRVAIARVLALDPPIMLMDEPFGALDALTRRSLQDELLRIWQATGKTIIFVTHSIEESIYLADRVVVMTYRPGTIKADIPLDLLRPRDTNAPEFNHLKRQIADMVMEEQRRFSVDEERGLTTD
jgi:NitT/TauT family transport system ATP-binding protein